MDAHRADTVADLQRLERLDGAAKDAFLTVPRRRVLARHRAFARWRRAEAQFFAALARERPWVARPDAAPPRANHDH